MSEQEQAKPTKEAILTPSQIAEMKDVGATLKSAARGPAQDIGMERSGQLSPPHTPGRGR